MSELQQQVPDQSSSVAMSSNEAYLDNNSLQIRLDPTPTINVIEQYLSGIQLQAVSDAEGNTSYKEVQVSKPLCNRQGARMIANYITGMCNPQVFQGKVKEDVYFDIIESIHRDLAVYLMSVRTKIEMSKESYQYAMSFLINFLKLELSGVIDGFRSNALAPTLKTVESNTIVEGSGGGFLSRRRRF